MAKPTFYAHLNSPPFFIMILSVALTYKICNGPASRSAPQALQLALIAIARLRVGCVSAEVGLAIMEICWR